MATKAIYEDFKQTPDIAQSIMDCIDEIDAAEENFAIVRSIDITPVTTLVQDLKTIFTFVRRALNTKHGIEFPADKMAVRKQKLPPRFRRETETPYRCLCPLTVFLQLFAQCLSDIHFTRQDEWGSLAPLRNLLLRMDKRIQEKKAARRQGNKDPGYEDSVCAGLATMLMFHEKNARYIVTASAPNYPQLVGLRQYAIKVRNDYIDKMWGGRPPKSVTDLLKYSEGIKKARQRNLDPEYPPNATKVVETIPGCNGSFANSGEYRVACLMDFFRFNISRPRAAEEKEAQTLIAKRMAFTPGSCAEWELYNTLLYNPDPQHPPPARQPVQRKTANGVPKQTTWDFEQCDTLPVPVWRQPYPNAPDPRQNQNDLLGVPPSLLKKSQKSATFNSNNPPRHPAATQFITPPTDMYKKVELLSQSEWELHKQQKAQSQQALKPQEAQQRLQTRQGLQPQPPKAEKVKKSFFSF